MGGNPLDTAWKIATSLHDRRSAPPAERDYYKATGYLTEVDRGMQNWFNDRVDDILNPWETRWPWEVVVLVWAAYATTMGYSHLGSILIKIYHLSASSRK